jgi:hypothetical protein
MKFSALPKHIQTQVLNSFAEAKQLEANDRMRYFAQNGYSTAEEYRQVVINEAPKVEQMRVLILDTMKSHYIKNGFEDWMSMIPNSDMICHRYKELATGPSHCCYKSSREL